MQLLEREAKPVEGRALLRLPFYQGWANMLVLGLWLWLYRPVFAYLSVIFSREEFRTNQVLLLAVLFLIAARVRNAPLQARLDAAPRLRPALLALVLGCSILYLAVERFLDINTLSASLFGLASYGLLGLWLEPRRWRQGLPAVLLLIGILPFGEHIQTFVGYPMRILTAALVRDGLAAAGVGSVGIDTILVFENGVSQVDLPCSGVKSLWTGALFLVAATWIERRPLNLRWLLLAFLLAGLLFVANLARVAILVAVGQVAGWQLLAEMLHVPLGVLGFAAACAAALAGLRRQPAAREEPASGSRSDLRPAWLTPGLALAILGLGLIYTPRLQTENTQPPPAWDFTAGLKTEPLPLSPGELDWFAKGGAESVDRRRFEWQASGGANVTGSVILITSRTWRAHHRPERCFEVYGLTMEEARTFLAGPAFPVRFVTLSFGDGAGLLSASYWYEADGRTTDDFAVRIWDDLAPHRDRWVLVTVLFDRMHDPQSIEIQTLYAALHETVQRNLRGGILE